MRLSTITYLFKQGLKNIGRNKMFSFTSIATMTICIFLFGLFFSLIANLGYTVEKAEESMPITVFFDEEITDVQRESIRMALESRDDVVEVKYVSAEEAWESFQNEYFAGNEEAAEGFADDNPLANSDNFEVYMRSIDKQTELVEYVGQLDGVRKVNKFETVAETMKDLNTMITYLASFIIGILLLVAIFLISNTVNMGIAVRREEIAIMKYIGAKDSFVKAPFVIEGVLIGVVGAAVPLWGFYYVYEFILKYVHNEWTYLTEIIYFQDTATIYRTLLPMGLLLGVGIGFVGSFFTIRKHLKV